MDLYSFCQSGTLCADLVILTGFLAPLPARWSSVLAYAMSLAFKKFIDSKWISPVLMLDLVREVQNLRLAKQKKMFRNSSIYTGSIGWSDLSQILPREFFWKEKSGGVVEDCGGSHVGRVGVISENSVTYRQRLEPLPLLEV
jgi:hypothetical protein